MVASVPEEVIRSISTVGMRSVISSASRSSASVGAPNVVPFSAASIIAAMTAGWAWPRINGPHEDTQSM